MSADIKRNKTCLSKITQSSRFLGVLSDKIASPSMKAVVPLEESILLAPLRVMQLLQQ